MPEKNDSPLRILAVFAHPDDSEFTCAGSAALWAAEGAHITYVVVTDGSAGSNAPGADLSALVHTREAEQRAACAVLGVQEVIFLRHPDGMLEPTLGLRREITRLIRRLQPDRVISGDPSAYYFGEGWINHPDHRAVAEATLFAVYPSAGTRPIFPELLDEGLEPHEVKELYMASDPAQVTTYVDITNMLERKIEALGCHKSQLDVGDGQWIRDWAAETGKPAGIAYAEAFRVFKLVEEKEE